MSELERDARAEKFLDELEDLCRKHQISIAHEDEHGGFILTEFHEVYMDWLTGARVDLATN